MQFSSAVAVIWSFFHSHGRHLSHVFLSEFKVWHYPNMLVWQVVPEKKSGQAVHVPIVAIEACGTKEEKSLHFSKNP